MNGTKLYLSFRHNQHTKNVHHTTASVILDHIHPYLGAADYISLCYASKSIFLATLAGQQMFMNIFSRCWLGNQSYDNVNFLKWTEDYPY